MKNIDFIFHEPATEYHERSRSGEFMSSHLDSQQFTTDPSELAHLSANG